MWQSLAIELGWPEIRFGMWMRKSHHRSEAGFGVGFVSFLFVLQFGTAVPLWGKHFFSCFLLSLSVFVCPQPRSGFCWHVKGAWRLSRATGSCSRDYVFISSFNIFISSHFKFLARLDHSTWYSARVHGSGSFVEVYKLLLVVKVFFFPALISYSQLCLPANL